MDKDAKGQIIGGTFGNILVRQKSKAGIQLGELVVSEEDGCKMILQVFDLLYGSQLSQSNIELISGLHLEEDTDLSFFDPNIRNYTLAQVKNLITLRDKDANLSKRLPSFFSYVRAIEEKDLSFMTKPDSPLFIGNIRSGSQMLDVPVFLNGRQVFAHHVLIPSTTGRGKSNLTSVMLWNAINEDYCAFLVLDPHDEYFGRNGDGLKDHPKSDKIVYYTQNAPPAGAMTLKINLRSIHPSHFNGVADWSDPQRQALSLYYKKYGQKWVEAALLEKPLDVAFNEGTISVVKRRLFNLLDIGFNEGRFFCKGIFDFSAGESTVRDIVQDLEQGKAVIVDTSNLSGAQEILVGSLITTDIFHMYKRHKVAGVLDGKPVVSIILEEAPRVLGKEVLERGSNIFATIAREGRKFKVGLVAITQLPSLIPRQILANMNTKIILGIEMAPERQAIIDSASQDLSSDARNIASLDRGEAIVTSNFTKFAVPVKIPLFADVVRSSKKKSVSRMSFDGMM
ncbi:ATPase [Candidatus Woesearchaeota archaeon CG11_big_fil_rev_8_21_14_0_20_43_8]|nr:MAG: ATPase [Candidatus Woesearchaeota archaeon CG11_big_fil_rev_8_21_14_0_20_43_8]